MDQHKSYRFKRRDKHHIIAEILEITLNRALKTQIMYRANLSFTQLNDYLRFMLKINLLNMTRQNNREVYKATKKGISFLQHWYEIREMLKIETNHLQNDVKTPPLYLLKGIKNYVKD